MPAQSHAREQAHTARTRGQRQHHAEQPREIPGQLDMFNALDNQQGPAMSNQMDPVVIQTEGIVTVIGTADVDTAIAAMNSDPAACDDIMLHEAAGENSRALFRAEWLVPEDDVDYLDWLPCDADVPWAVPALIFGE